MNLNNYRAEVTNNPLFIMFAEEMAILYARNDELNEQIEERNRFLAELQETIRTAAQNHHVLQRQLIDSHELYQEMVTRIVDLRITTKHRIEQLETINHDLAMKLLEERSANRRMGEELRRIRQPQQEYDSGWTSKKPKH